MIVRRSGRRQVAAVFVLVHVSLGLQVPWRELRPSVARSSLTASKDEAIRVQVQPRKSMPHANGKLAHDEHHLGQAEVKDFMLPTETSILKKSHQGETSQASSSKSAFSEAKKPTQKKRRIHLPWLRSNRGRFIKRSATIWKRALRFAIKFYRTTGKLKKGSRSPEAVEARRSLAYDLKEELIALGPTFIKFGQLLSTRVDVFPPEVIQELVALQNDVPGFPAERAKAIISQELGIESVYEIFARFDEKPLAAASLAQVHRAQLLDGTEVVVKVQRDGLNDLIAIDFRNIRWVAALADRLDPEEEGVSSNWLGIAKSAETVLWKEIDFRIERENCNSFQQNMQSLPYVKVPDTYKTLCSQRVLVMEFVEGRKITDPSLLEDPEIDGAALSARLTTSYLEQLCRHGFFHCDPHPGNVAVDTQYPGGRIIYYDFGMCDTIPNTIKKSFVDVVYALYKNEPILAVDALEGMGVLRPGLDRFSIERIARDYVNTFADTVSSDTKAWENQMSPEEIKAERRRRRAKLGADLFATQAERPFIFPPNFTFVFRAVTTIDGIGKFLDPKYDLTKLSSPYLRELADLRDGSAAKTAALDILQRIGLRPTDINQFVTQPRRVASVKNSIDRISEGDLKLRVRALELERMIDRLETKHDLFLAAFFCFVSTQIAIQTSPLWILPSSVASFSAIGAFIKGTGSYFKLRKLDRNRKRFDASIDDQIKEREDM